MNNNFIIPRRVTIETIFGCNAKCLMCPIDLETPRKKCIMPMDMFKNIIDSLVSYKDKIEMMDLYGLGEPLLDPNIFERIKYIKEKGFKNLAFSTNADKMDQQKQKQILESCIDTVLFSIDGVKKETHESIRRGTNFEQVVKNCENIIKMRNDGNYKTRFIFRFIRQDINRNEWDLYKEYWLKRISKEHNDFITVFDVHSWGGEVYTKDTILDDSNKNDSIEKMACPIITDVLYILADGIVPLCNEDWHKAQFNFGNVNEKPAIEIFNSEKFNKIRKIHSDCRKSEINICKDCTVLYSQQTKENIFP